MTLTFFHSGRFAAFNNRHRFTRMYSVRRNAVSVQIANAFNLVGLAVQIDLIRLHDFLYGLTQVTQSHVNASLLDTTVGGRLDRLQQLVILGIERNCESAIDDVSVDVCAKINFANVVVLTKQMSN